MAALRLDEAVLLTSFHQSPLPTALLLRLAGVGRITGASADYPGSLLDVRLRPGEDDLPEDLPEPQRALRIAAAAGFRLPAGDDGRLAVRPPPAARAGLAGPGRVVLHPGAAVAARRWPPRTPAGRGALAAAGHRVVVTGAPTSGALTALVAGRRGLDLGGRTTLRRAGRGAGRRGRRDRRQHRAAHLAAAVGTPVVSLFAPVVPAVRWRPYRVPHVLLGDQHAPCRDTRARECPVPGHPCLSRGRPAEVVAAVRALPGAAVAGVPA